MAQEIKQPENVQPNEKTAGDQNKRHTFGTFSGVFTPNILTILGVILYLRLGWVTGSAGLFYTLVILLVAQSITFLTGLSLSAVCTNMKLKGGGAYYLISRSLGIEIGGAIGLPLYLAQTFGIGLYIVGFTEIAAGYFPEVSARVIGFIALAVLTLIAIISPKLVERVQYIVLGVIALSIVSFVLGANINPDTIAWKSSFPEGYDFWLVFAVFFPAVTGMEAGLSMSGDLKDPKKSIPWGTLTAIVTGFLVYFGMILVASMSISQEELVTNPRVLIEQSRWPILVLAGIFAATLSSALASIMAAPRTLQALGDDKVVPLKGKNGKTGLLVPMGISVVLSAGVILIGDLNIIAPILTMFFLITYGSINAIAAIEGFIGRPSYRPAFKIHPGISLLGAFATFVVMFILNFWACMAGLAIVVGLFIYLEHRSLQDDWGDARRGFWHALVQYSLNQLNTTEDHPKNWRPDILVFTKFHLTRVHLAQIAGDLAQGRGLVTLVQFIDLDEKGAQDKYKKEDQQIKKLLEGQQITAFNSVALTDDAFDAQMITAQVHGIGQYKPNTILMEWAESKSTWFGSGKEFMAKQMRQMEFYRSIGKNLLLLNVNKEQGFGSMQKIDVWWDPTQENGSFMLLLGHLIATAKRWDDSIITLRSIVPEHSINETQILLEELCQKARIKAAIEVLYPVLAEEEQTKVDGEDKQSRISNMFKKLSGKAKEGLEAVDAVIDSVGIDSESDVEQNETQAYESQLAQQIGEKEKRFLDKYALDIIREKSEESDLVILGFNVPERGEVNQYISQMDDLLQKLPTTLLVHCSFDVELFA